jgi:hypothetical protein
MASQVAILHGWSDTSKSFRPLVAFLDANGFKSVPLWLGDYISLDDDVRIEDVAKRMQQVIQDKMANEGLKAPFDLIVHSTGGLVARQWLADFYPDGKGCPVQRIVMLAPANFGSKLAALGQSMLGRVIKGWKNWFHTGKEMLRGLELASPYQWALAQRDLLAAEAGAIGPTPYGKQGVWPFIIVGSHPYDDKLRQIVNESGADGTVRAAAANLNARGVTVDFASNEDDPAITLWEARFGDMAFPLAVLPDRDHGSIIDPNSPGYSSDKPTQQLLGKLILDALNCESFDTYRQMAVLTSPAAPGLSPWRKLLSGTPTWADITEATAALGQDDAERGAVFGGDAPPAEYFHQYLQVIVHVVDDHGSDVADYYLEFFAPEAKTDAEAVYFQTKVMEDVHPYGENGSYRCLFVDRTDLLNVYYSKIPPSGKKQLAMSISAVRPGDNVSYFHNSVRGAAGYMVVHRQEEVDPTSRWLKRNCTHFVKIIIPRVPEDKVFTLTKLPRGGR